MSEFSDAPEASTKLYHPLQDATPSHSDVDEHLTWGIRLLQLLPGDPNSPIHCNLSVSTIGKSLGAFEALSYVWGTPGATGDVVLGGRSVVVTWNLQCALRCLRSKTSARLLWVDALGIDQTSTEEKNTQVPRMWAVYTFARRVLIFLGDEADDSDQALHLLHTISELRSDDLDTVANMVGDPSLKPSWSALLKLTQRQWWCRAWIIQEYAVATNVQFLCGTHILQGEEFSKAINLLIEYRFKGIVPQKQAYLIRHVASTSIHHLWSTRDEYQRDLQPQKQAVDILYKFRVSKSSDPRDKIFSVYKLIGRIPGLAPDYSRSVQDLYQAVVRTTMEQSGTLEVLSHHNRNVESRLMLPSWCPDWTIMRGKRILLWPNRYQACGSRGKARVLIKDGVLALVGVPITHVRVLERFPAKRFSDVKNLYDAMHLLQEQTRGRTHLDSNEAKRLDIFRRTLVASRIRFNGPRGSATILGEHQADTLWEAWSAQASSGIAGLESSAKTFNDALFSALCGRALVLTDNDSLGIVDEPVQDGDLICAFPGGQVLLCIRATDTEIDRKTYQLVGEW